MDPMGTEVLSLHGFELCARSCVNRSLGTARVLSSYLPAPKEFLSGAREKDVAPENAGHARRQTIDRDWHR